jgi:hypothetical protein
MKTIFFTTMLLGLMACGAHSQVPKKVANEFNSKYNTAQNVSWYFEDGQYKASFDYNDYSKEACFKEDGTWLMTTTVLETDILMSCLTDYVSESYENTEIVEAEFIEKPESEKYYVTVEIAEESEEENEEDESFEIRTSSIRLIFDGECEFLGEE